MWGANATLQFLTADILRRAPDAWPFHNLLCLSFPRYWQTIEGVRSATDHRAIDLLVLLILHSTSHKKVVESLFRNKIRAGHFTEVLLQATFSSHSQVGATARCSHWTVKSINYIMVSRSLWSVMTYFNQIYIKNFLSYLNLIYSVLRMCEWKVRCYIVISLWNGNYGNKTILGNSDEVVL